MRPDLVRPHPLVFRLGLRVEDVAFRAALKRTDAYLSKLPRTTNIARLVAAGGAEGQVARN